MIIAISGLAGSGKDTIADQMRQMVHSYKVSLGDQLKRVAKEVYDFSVEQLWGPSDKRNATDERYERTGHTWSEPTQEEEQVSKCLCCGLDYQDAVEAEGTIKCYLTPRYALQRLGTEWARDCYPNTWIDYVLRTANKLLHKNSKGLTLSYNPVVGVEEGAFFSDVAKAVIIPDVRFRNEILQLRMHGAKLIRIKRPGFEKARWNHRSETEQLQFQDDAFDFVWRNDTPLAELPNRVRDMMLELKLL